MRSRHIKALRHSSVLALFLSVPLIFIIRYHKTSSDTATAPGCNNDVQDFYFEVQGGKPFTKTHLKNKITLLAIAPAGCRQCGEDRFGTLTSQAVSGLSYQGKAHSQKQKPWQLLYFGAREFFPGDPWVHLENPTGLAASRKSLEPELRAFTCGHLLNPDSLSWLLIDEHARLIGIFEDSAKDRQDLDWRWSKATFNYYLSDYLSKRTFFGPRRKR